MFGPARGDARALGRSAAHFCALRGVERLIYLGADGLLDQVVTAWAQDLVGENATDAALWDRAAATCTETSAPGIMAFVHAERQRTTLRRLESLATRHAWSVELVGGRWALMAASTAHLGEDHLASVSFVVFGDAPEPLMERRGSRWLISPGPITSCAGLLLYEDEKSVRAALVGPDLVTIRDECLASGHATKLRITDDR